MKRQPDKPHKAILLAAGFGSRMVPLSHDLPKPMMPLWGIPVIGHVMHAMQCAGVRDILINLHHNPQPIVDWARGRSASWPRLQFSFEPEIAGTGGALRKASHFIGNEPFWLVNTDIAFDLDPAPLVADFQRHQPLATLWLDATRGPRTVETDASGQITSFASPSPGAPGTCTFCGMQILSPAILDYLPDTPFSTVIDGYREALRQGLSVRGCRLDDTFWADLGTPERYLAAHRDILEARRHKRPGGALLQAAEARRMRRCIPAGAQASGFVAIGRDVTIPGDASLSDCVIWDGAELKPGARLAGSVVGRHAIVRTTQQGGSSVRSDVLPADPVLAAVLRTMRTTPASTTLTALPARGSDRRFERLQTERCSRVLVRYDDQKRPENARYAPLARALAAAGIRVPRVVLDMPEQKATLFADAGTRSLQDELPGLSRTARIRHYRRVIGQVLRLHALSPADLPPLEPPFSPALYRWEHDLFITHFLTNTLRMEITAPLRRLLKTCSTVLQRQPQVPVHRDLQSSNILLPQGGPVLIDFQGIRMGAAAYDLASLLCDPYVMLDEADRNTLLDDYCAASPHGASVRAAFPYAAIQRLAQALGAFGRLSANPATARFAKHIPPATAMFNTMQSTIEKSTGRCALGGL
jgi:NDP-sugar pyrophosphorylase family protein/streptomycin 6-kinase